jgi:large subunit ribosomal protein L10
MLTRKEKEQIIEGGLKRIGENKTLVFFDFSGSKANKLNEIRGKIRKEGGLVEVIKKKLLRIALEKAGADFNPESFEGQAATVFSPEEIQPVAALLVKNKEIKILGGWDLVEKRFFPGEEVIMLGRLPSREVLLAQVVGTIAAPLSAFLYVLKERSKQVA